MILTPSIPMPTLTWEDIYEAKRSGPNIPGVDPVAIEQAFEHLRRIFQNPMKFAPLLLEQVLNATPDASAWLLWLSDSLRRLAPCQGFRSLSTRLADPDRFMEALSVLQVGERLDSAGFSVAIDMPVRIGGLDKRPDIGFFDRGTNDVFLCEVSVHFSARDHERLAALQNEIFWLLREDPADILASAVCVLPNAPTKDMGGLLNAVAWEIMEVRRDRQFRVVTIDDAVTLALAGREEQAAVRAWAAAHGQDLDSLWGLPPAIDPARRLWEKVEDKAKQLSPDAPNLLVLVVQDLYIAAGNPKRLVPLVRETIVGWPTVSALVLLAEGTGAELIGNIDLGDVRIVGSRRGGEDHRYLIAINGAAAHQFTAGVLERLVTAFSL